jgi:hypothetical protein
VPIHGDGVEGSTHGTRAQWQQPFTLAIAQLAYEGDEGPELAYRIERFSK